MSGPDLLALSDERDRHERRRLAERRADYLEGACAGWKAALEYVQRIRQDDFAPIARLMLAMAGNDRMELDELEDRRWGPGGREHAGDPRPGDHTGAELVARARRSWEHLGLAPDGYVHLSGRALHHHQCTAACSSYQPGWYTPEAAIEILVTLPGDYKTTIAELRHRADDEGRGRAA